MLRALAWLIFCVTLAAGGLVLTLWSETGDIWRGIDLLLAIPPWTAALVGAFLGVVAGFGLLREGHEALKDRQQTWEDEEAAEARFAAAEAKAREKRLLAAAFKGEVTAMIRAMERLHGSFVDVAASADPKKVKVPNVALPAARVFAANAKRVVLLDQDAAEALSDLHYRVEDSLQAIAGTVNGGAMTTESANRAADRLSKDLLAAREVRGLLDLVEKEAALPPDLLILRPR